MTSTKKVLTIISDEEVFDRLEPLFIEAEADVGRAHDGETALALGVRQRFDLVVADFPSAGADLIEVLERLRRSGSRSADSPIIVLARPAFQPSLRRLQQPNFDAPVACASLEEAMRATARLLNLNNRVTERLLVQMEMVVDSMRIQRAVQTENISASGMLLRTKRTLPVGSVLPFSLELPYDTHPIHGRAQVVRHAELETEAVSGMGVKFLGLDGDGTDRLSNFMLLSGPAPRAR